MVLQETYELLDAIFYDDTTTDNSSKYYINSTYSSISYSENSYILVLGSSAQYVDLRNIVDSVKGKTVSLEVDLELPPNVRARLRTQALTQNVGGDYVSGTATAKLLNIEIPSDETDMYFRLEFQNASADDVIKFKNFKIYPV